MSTDSEHTCLNVTRNLLIFGLLKMLTVTSTLAYSQKTVLQLKNIIHSV